MKLTLIFKRLVLSNLFVFLILLAITLLETESSQVKDFNNSVAVNDLLMLLALVWIFAFFVSLYFIYKFKKVGRQLFFYVFVIGIIMIVSGGPIAFDAASYALDSLATVISGAIIVLSYFSPLNKEFKK
tara:strand:- start:973 stop:1359 length:387 start_codon:yes stop_codon:yes gene_type:complete